MNNIIIETDRLFLRKLDLEDTKVLLELFSDPVAMEFFPSVKTNDEVNEWIQKNIDSYLTNKFGLYLCVLKQNSHAIGYCGFILQTDVESSDEVEIGYGLIRKFWHKGYATEAAIGCKKYGFEKMKLENVISLIRPENIPSINVAIRNGMTWKKDIMRWDYLHGIYSISKSEYLEEISK
jgi:RimJ/RimL family protein N-acetyltransferase